MTLFFPDLLWSLSCTTLTLYVFVLVLLVTYVPKWKRSYKYKNLPPGPFCWPVIGYGPLLKPKSFYRNLEEDAKKYGDVFSIYMGNKYTIVINDFETLKNAYNKDAFLGRPEGMYSVSNDPRQTSIIGLGGSKWKEQKRFLTSSFRQMGVGSELFCASTKAQITRVIDELASKEDQVVDLNEVVELALSNVTFSLLYGKTFDRNHDMITILRNYHEKVKLFLELTIVKTLYPKLGFVYSFFPRFQGVKEVLEEMDTLIKQEVTEHQQNLNETEPLDLLHHFLLQMNKPNSEKDFNMFTLLGNMKFQLGASSETMRATSVWFLLLMADDIETQDKIHEEIINTIGREREPQLADRSKLLLLGSSLLESIRFKSIVILNILRTTLEDTTLCGYDIPKGTLVLHNMQSQFMNPKYWKDPDQFHPSRFLSEDRKTLQVPPHFTPFSYGKRSCPGEKVAMTTMFLLAARILQNFKILPAGEKVRLDEMVMFTNTQLYPYARFQRRI